MERFPQNAKQLRDHYTSTPGCISPLSAHPSHLVSILRDEIPEQPHIAVMIRRMSMCLGPVGNGRADLSVMPEQFTNFSQLFNTFPSAETKH